jgi:hypothetical protein
MSEGETCSAPACKRWPQFPDENGYLFCQRHHNGQFPGGIPEDRRSELREAYDHLSNA